MAENVNEGRHQVKRKYGVYNRIRVNENGASVRDTIIKFVGKNYVTEEDLNNHLIRLEEDRGGVKINKAKWFKRNQKFFTTFEKRNTKYIGLSKYGMRVLEMIGKRDAPAEINESTFKNIPSLSESIALDELNEAAFPTQYTTYQKGKVTYTGQQFKDNALDWGQSERDIAEQMAGDIGLVNGTMYWGPNELNIEGTDKDGREIIVQQKGEYNMYGGPYTPQMKKFNVVLSKGTLTGPILKAFKKYGWDIKGSGGYPDISRTDIWGHLMPSNFFMQGGKNKMR